MADLSGKNKEFRVILIALVILLAFLIFKELRIYVGGFLAAAALYVVFRGQMIYLVEKKKFGRKLSSTIIVLQALLLILIPLTGLGFLVADTLSGIKIDPEQIMTQITDFFHHLEDTFGFPIFAPENITFFPKVSSSLLQSLVSNLYAMVINTIIAVFLLYFMLSGYESFEKALTEILPFREENKLILREETKSIIQANAIGIPAVALIQGILAYIGYVSLGVNTPLIYAILVSFTTIIPILGTALVWIPIGLTPLLEGDISRGIMLLAYGLLIIGGSDTVIRFLLQKKIANIHPLITLFGVFIGISMFGFWGIIFGPLLISLFVLFFNMYRKDYIPESDAEPRVTTRKGLKKGWFVGKRKKKSPNPPPTTTKKVLTKDRSQ